MQKASVETILSELNAASIRYLVVGGLAVAAHGYLRTTVDVDLVLDLERSNLERALAVFSRLGYRPRAPVSMQEFVEPEKRRQWVVEKGLTVFSLNSPDHPATEVDIFVEAPFDFNRAFRSAARISMTDSIVAVFVGYDDLIEMKKKAGRSQDLIDINQLELIRKANG